MTTEWRDLPTMADVAEAKKNEWEIEHSYNGIKWFSWQGCYWDADWKFRSRPRKQTKTIVLRRALMRSPPNDTYYATEPTNYDHSLNIRFVMWLPGEEIVEVPL